MHEIDVLEEAKQLPLFPLEIPSFTYGTRTVNLSRDDFDMLIQKRKSTITMLSV